MTKQLMIIRHGFSTWNEKNLFTGWVDVALSEIGVDEAKRAGRAINKIGFSPDVVFTSVLKRAIDTADLALDEITEDVVETHRSWRLNERHYGALTGLDKKETVQKYGEEQVGLWRRSYDVPPPPVEDNSEYDFSKDPLYADVPCSLIPKTECLKDVRDRVLPYWQETIAPTLLNDKTVMVVAHGNSLRALIMEIENISPEDISKFELPTATPRLYEFGDDLSLINASYIEDEEEVLARASAVKAQTAK